MSVATKPGFAIVFLMMLTLGLPLGFPAENVPETAYDESEALPYESVPVFSIGVPPAAAQTAKRVLSSLHLRFGAPPLFAAAPVYDTDANRPGGARASLALLCTLLC